jgi:hypothetical protein
MQSTTALKVSSKAQPGSVADTARAFATYSLVPYLGILFCPGAVLVSSVGIVRSYRAIQANGRRTCYASLLVGLIVLAVQSFLWWILYKVPGWARGF